MSFMNTLTKLATTVGGAMSGGTIPALFEIGKSVLDLIDNAKDVVGEDDVIKLEALREELEPKVMAHADKTEETLRGQG